MAHKYAKPIVKRSEATTCSLNRDKATEEMVRAAASMGGKRMFGSTAPSVKSGAAKRYGCK